MKIATFIFCILNLISFIFYNFEYRIDQSLIFSNNFIFRDYLEKICYAYFTFETIFKIIATGFVFGPNTYLRDWWHLFFLLTLIARYLMIFFFLYFLHSWAIYFPSNPIQKLCLCIRLMGPIRLILLFHPLKKNLTNIVKALVSVSNYFISVLGLMVFYAVIGLYLFYGLDENRCRETQHPEHGEWEVMESIESFCGSWKCNEGFIILLNFHKSLIFYRFCGNPADYNMPFNRTENQVQTLNYGLTNFRNIFSSLWNVFQFMDVMGWTGINYPVSFCK